MKCAKLSVRPHFLSLDSIHNVYHCMYLELLSWHSQIYAVKANIPDDVMHHALAAITDHLFALVRRAATIAIREDFKISWSLSFQRYCGRRWSILDPMLPSEDRPAWNIHVVQRHDTKYAMIQMHITNVPHSTLGFFAWIALNFFGLCCIYSITDDVIIWIYFTSVWEFT